MHNSTLIIATATGLVAAISWGTADFLAAKSSKSKSPGLTALYVSLIAAVIFSIIFAIDHGSHAWSVAGIIYTLVSGLFIGSGLLAFYHGLELGPVSIVSPVGSAYPLVTTLIVLLFLGGTLSLIQALGIVLIITGIVVASGLLQAKKSERHITRGVLFAIITFVLWGVGFALLSKAVLLLGWQKETFLDIWFELLVITLILYFTNGSPIFSRKNALLLKDKFIVVTALIQLFGLIIFNIGLTKTKSSAVITAVSASYPALTVFLAVRQLKEKQSLVPLMGGALTIVGIVILSI